MRNQTPQNPPYNLEKYQETPTRILLVDDSHSANYFNKMILQKTVVDSEVTIASNSLQALEYIKSAYKEGIVPDLIFLDINMPVMDGWEFLEIYKKLPDALQSSVIIITLGSELTCAHREIARKLDVMIQGFCEKMLRKETILNLVAIHL